jgi:hypothetical protein
VKTVGIWISGLLGAGLMGLLFGAMLDGPYHVTNTGMFWRATNALLSGALWGAILGLLAFAFARLWLASGES